MHPRPTPATIRSPGAETTREVFEELLGEFIDLLPDARVVLPHSYDAERAEWLNRFDRAHNEALAQRAAVESLGERAVSALEPWTAGSRFNAAIDSFEFVTDGKVGTVVSLAHVRACADEGNRAARELLAAHGLEAWDRDTRT